MRLLFSLLDITAIAPAQTRYVQFDRRVLAADLRGGYQVVVSDVNKDGKPDLVALASGMTELYWLEAPNWERHVLAAGLKRMINTWPMDTDGDGISNADEGVGDPDNDGDGVLDAQDLAPDLPEDVDGFEDGDGRPDRDNDSDGIPDEQHGCPNEPEDFDGDHDVDGCPDVQRDVDGSGSAGRGARGS